MRRICLLTIWTAALPDPAPAQTWYHKDISTAYAQAKKQKKPLWIMFSATWCGPCKLVEKQIFPDLRFQEAIRRDFIPLRVYASSGDENTPGGDSLAKVYAIRAFPTFLYVEPSGQTFYRHIGIPYDPTQADTALIEPFLKKIEMAKKSRKELPDMHRRFEKGDRSPEFLRSYLAKLVEIDLPSEGRKVFEAYLKAVPSARLAWLGEPGYVKLLPEIASWDDRYKSYVLAIADTLRSELPRELYRDLYHDILISELKKRLKGIRSWSKTVDTTEKFIREYRDKFDFIEELALEMVWKGGIHSPEANAEIREQAASLGIKAVALGYPLEIPEVERREQLADAYNTLAWEFYERVSDPDKLWTAVILTKQALAFKPDAWYIWDTLGALYYKLGRKREALNALNKAVEIAQKEGREESEYQQTIELLNKARELTD
ncbi:MAG: thioredoxin family protein [Bacteroidia bacterium]|nr:thioredoxin family protein [Bacteroidia bacterium]